MSKVGSGVEGMSEPNLPRKDDGGERRPGFRAAGASLPRVVGPIVAKHGGGVLARLKADWAAIVGAELAAACWPEALGRGGTLKLRVTPMKALEIQHRAPLVAERINRYFGRGPIIGWRLVRVLPLPEATPARELSRALAAETAARPSFAEISDSRTRQALDRLGRAVIAAKNDKRRRRGLRGQFEPLTSTSGSESQLRREIWFVLVTLMTLATAALQWRASADMPPPAAAHGRPADAHRRRPDPRQIRCADHHHRIRFADLPALRRL